MAKRRIPAHKSQRSPKKDAHADLHDRIEQERRKLQRASAVLLALVYSSDSGLEVEQAADIADVARDLVEGALGGLDVVALNRPGGAS